MVGVEPLQGEGLELRMLVKLRIQNPNDLPLDFNGVSVTMNVQGKRFATGVSDAGGSVPRFGEAIVNVPVSVSVFRIARQAVGVMTDEFRGKLTYEMNGKLAGTGVQQRAFQVERRVYVARGNRSGRRVRSLLLADHHLADLHHGLLVRVIGDIGHDFLGMRTEATLKRLD